MAGILSKLAIVQGSTWGTAATLTTGHRAPFKGSTLQRAIAKILDDDVKGKATRGIPTNGSESVPGMLSFTGDYRQTPHFTLAALLMGIGATPTTVESGVYAHVLPFQPTTDGLFATIGVDLGGADVHAFKSCKPTSRTIRIAGGGKWEEQYQFLGAGLDSSVASSGWTYAYDPNGNGARRVLASQTVIRCNTHAGAALDSTYVIKPRLVTITIGRGLTQDFPVGQTYGDEPILGDFAEITITLEFFDTTAALLALFRDNKDADTPLKLDIVATHGTLLGSTQYRQRKLYFPKLSIDDVPTDIDGPGPQPFKVTLSAHFSDVVPTGFPSGYDEEVTEVIQYERSTALLA